MRRLVPVLLLALAGVLMFAVISPVGAQTCDDPALEAEETTVRAGDPITVTGTGFDPECAEGAGPHSPDVVITLVQGDATEELATVKATDDDPSFEADLDIPSDLNPGSATLTAQGAAGNATLGIQITVGTQVSPGDDGATVDDGDAATNGDLAETGLEATALIGLAFGLLLFGIALEWVAQLLPARL